jgi:hypothetical protein
MPPLAVWSVIQKSLDGRILFYFVMDSIQMLETCGVFVFRGDGSYVMP